MRRSLVLLPLVVVVGCVVRVSEGPGSAQPGSAPAVAQATPAQPAPGQPAQPAPGQPGQPAPVGTAPPVAPIAGAGGFQGKALPGAPMKPGLGIKPAPIVKQPNAFGGSTPSPTSIAGNVFAIPAGTSKLPDFSKLQPFATIYTSAWDVSPRKFDEGFPGVSSQSEWFAIRWEGDVRAFNAGPHTFKIVSDDGAKLYVDGQLVVDNDGTHPPKLAAGVANLASGSHRLAIEYFQGPKYEIALQVWVTPPNGTPRILTASF